MMCAYASDVERACWPAPYDAADGCRYARAALIPGELLERPALHVDRAAGGASRWCCVGCPLGMARSVASVERRRCQVLDVPAPAGTVFHCSQASPRAGRWGCSWSGLPRCRRGSRGVDVHGRARRRLPGRGVSGSRPVRSGLGSKQAFAQLGPPVTVAASRFSRRPRTSAGVAGVAGGPSEPASPQPCRGSSRAN